VSEIRFLKNVDVRSVWLREDRDFTPWLASEEPLQHLLDACGIEMGSEPSIRTEMKIPGLLRSLDIFVELENGERIAIENQFSEADHDHLTRALAYAVGLEANTIILVAESHRPEFVAVAQYLNGAGLAYEDHGIRVILVRLIVETSPGSNIVHPKFEVIAEPDEWKAAVDLVTQGQFSERDAATYNFHEKLLPLVRQATGSFMRVQPSKNSWKSGAFGVRGVTVTYGARKDATYVQIWFSRENSATANHAGMAVLESHRVEVEEELKGHSLDWRKGGVTAMLEVVIDAIGYSTDLNPVRMEEVANVAGKMATLVHKYRSEIATAMNVPLLVVDTE
jgi:hypothetical protein